MNNSLPFPTEVTNMTDPITDAVVRLRQKFESDKQADHAAILREAEAAWIASENARKNKFIRIWMNENYTPLTWPYERYTDEDLFRVSLPYETRIEELLRAKLYSQALLVYLYRSGGEASVDDVKEFLRSHIPVDGTRRIYTRHGDLSQPEDVYTNVHAKRLSDELCDLFRANALEVRFETVSWVHSESDDGRKILAPQALPKEDW